MKSRRQWPGRVTLGYIAILSASFAVAMIAGWTSLAEGMEGSAYDWLFSVQPPAPVNATSVVLAFDDACPFPANAVCWRHDGWRRRFRWLIGG